MSLSPGNFSFSKQFFISMQFCVFGLVFLQGIKLIKANFQCHYNSVCTIVH